MHCPYFKLFGKVSMVRFKSNFFLNESLTILYLMSCSGFFLTITEQECTRKRPAVYQSFGETRKVPDEKAESWAGVGLDIRNSVIILSQPLLRDKEAQSVVDIPLFCSQIPKKELPHSKG